MLLGCEEGGSANQEALETLQQVETAWAARSEQERSLYCFTENKQSMVGEERTVTLVEHGAVTELHYRRTQGLDANLVEEWTERDAELGSHHRPVRTMEDVFTYCRKIIDSPLEEYSPTLTAAANGLLENCFVEMDDGCIDDCSYGIRLSSIAFGEGCKALLQE